MLRWAQHSVCVRQEAGGGEGTGCTDSANKRNAAEGGNADIAGEDDTYLLLISPAIVTNARSTLVAIFALVSRKGMPRSSANAYIHAEGTKGGGG